MSEIKKTRTKKNRLDIESELYENVFSYAKEHGIKESTKGWTVISAIKHMFDLVSNDPIVINEKTKTALDSFQKFGVLEGDSLTEAVNKALEIYIKEHKSELQEKIGEL